MSGAQGTGNSKLGNQLLSLSIVAALFSMPWNTQSASKCRRKKTRQVSAQTTEHKQGDRCGDNPGDKCDKVQVRRREQDRWGDKWETSRNKVRVTKHLGDEAATKPVPEPLQPQVQARRQAGR